MITKIRIKNFRQIEDQTIELSQAVVFIGPNNGGKTTALQAISLFAIAVRFWGEQRIDKKSKASKRTGVAINIDDLRNIPITEYKEIWKDLNVREGILNKEGKPTAKNIRIEIHCEGFTKDEAWRTGFEFDYGRDSLIYARLTKDDSGNPYQFPEILLEERFGYLPSVAGLNPIEDKLELGSILRQIGNGKTSDVLRNICYYLFDREDKTAWEEFVNEIDKLFRIKINSPKYHAHTGLLKMSYNEDHKKNIDLSSLGSGAKQAILMFAYLLAFPNTVNLLDEPDAHLEVIRQSNIYDKITDMAKKNNSQIIIASHSESVLNRAFGKDCVISAVFGQLEIVNHRSYVTSILRDYGYEQFITAKQRPHILYFEGNTDFDFIKSFCRILNKEAYIEFMDNNIYPYPISGNDVNRARNHFAALRSFIPTLKGYALFDNLDRELEKKQDGLILKQWQRKEIENYLPLPNTLYTYIEKQNHGPIFLQRFKEIVIESIPPAAVADLNHTFWKTTKISDDFLTPLFEKFLNEMGLPKGLMDKSKFYLLVEFTNYELLDQELINTIDEMFKHLMPA